MELQDKINNILANWDPIEVGGKIAFIEYSGYIPIILNNLGSKDQLFKCLIHILKDDLGLDFDLNNQVQVKDLLLICDKIKQI